MADVRTWTVDEAAPRLASAERLRLFALNATADLGKAIADRLGLELSAHEELEFEDGEHKARPLVPVGNADVFVIQSLHGEPSASVNDKLCRLLFFIGALKDAGAQRVTAVVPYLCYARKDRRTKPHEPVTTRYIATMFEGVGADAVVTLEVHNPAAFENAFRIRTVALTAAPLFLDWARKLRFERLCVVSPDTGGAKRAEFFRQALEAQFGRPVGMAFAEKYRGSRVLTGDLVVGDVNDATVLIIDDLISTGGTLVRAAQAARRAGAVRILALAAHGLFVGRAADALANPAIGRLVVTDSVPVSRLPAGTVREKLEVLPSAPLFAEAIARLYQGHGLSDLLVQ